MKDNRAFIISKDKTEEFFESLKSTCKSQKEWNDMKKESEVIDTEKLKSLFR